MLPHPYNEAVPSGPRNLPAQLSTFIGRERQVAEIARLVNSARLVTLTGAGGTGKTRLALQLAASLETFFRNGVALVELAAFNDPSFIPQLISRSVGLTEQTGQSLLTALSHGLAGRQVLIILDNCEHLIEECAQVAEALLKACPELKILATSRELLGIAGETAYRVPPLSLPAFGAPVELEELLGYEGVRLFVERARAVKPTFSVTSQNMAAVVELCQQLDGIPLAIELAAARLGTITVEQLNSRLAGAFGARFQLLTGGSRTALPRQQTLRALIEWSYNLLSLREQVLLKRLTVFSGGWSLEAAEAVCPGEFTFADGWGNLESAEILDLLTQLVNKSLVVVEEITANGVPAAGATAGAAPQMRYRLLETIRQFAREKLIEAAEIELLNARYCDWAIARAEEAERHLNGPEQINWLDWLESEHQNFQAALQWSIIFPNSPNPAAQTERGYRLAGALWRFWLARSYFQEGYKWLQALPPAPDLDPALTAKVGTGLAVLKGYALNDFDQGIRLHQENLAQARRLNDRPGMFTALFELGWSYSQQSQFEEADRYARQALQIARETGDERSIAAALLLTANNFLCIAASDSLNNNSGFDWAVGHFQEVKATIISDPRLDIIRDYCLECLKLWQNLNDKGSQGITLHLLGYASLFKGEYSLAKSYLAASYENEFAVGNKQAQLMMTWTVAYMAIFHEQREVARVVELIGAARKLMVNFNLVHFPRYFFWVDYTEAILKNLLGPANFEAALASGARLNYDQFQALVRDLLQPDQPTGNSGPAPAPNAAQEFKTASLQPSSPYPAGLTEREIEVLRLVAQGHTDAEAAAQLTLSPRTVNAHLRSIYAKIEVTSRRAAAQFARHNNLL